MWTSHQGCNKMSCSETEWVVCCTAIVHFSSKLCTLASGDQDSARVLKTFCENCRMHLCNDALGFFLRVHGAFWINCSEVDRWKVGLKWSGFVPKDVVRSSEVDPVEGTQAIGEPKLLSCTVTSFCFWFSQQRALAIIFSCCRSKTSCLTLNIQIEFIGKIKLRNIMHAQRGSSHRCWDPVRLYDIHMCESSSVPASRDSIHLPTLVAYFLYVSCSSTHNGKFSLWHQKERATLECWKGRLTETDFFCTLEEALHVKQFSKHLLLWQESVEQ